MLDEVAATGKRTSNTWIQDTRDTLHKLHLDPRVTVTLRWVPGHVGLYYNEEVDELAKQGAKDSTINLDNMRGTKMELKVHETAMRKLNKKGKNSGKKTRKQRSNEKPDTWERTHYRSTQKQTPQDAHNMQSQE